MSFRLTAEQTELRDLVRRFVDRELIPVEMQASHDEDELDAFVAPFRESIEQMGLWLIEAPAEFGGPGLSLLERCIVREEVSRTKALPFRDNRLFGPRVGAILSLCNAEQRERFLLPVIRGEMTVCFAQTEPDAGSDPARMRTRAVRDGDFYLVNGVKRYISGAGRADFAQVTCVTDPEKGVRGGISTLLIDMRAPGVTLGRRQDTMMGDRPWEIVFTDVRVPVANRVGDEGGGFELAQSWLTANRILAHGAACIGIAQRSLEMAIDYALLRETFGQPLSERQAIQFMIADSATEILTARLLVYSTASRFDEGEDVRDESYMCKVVCTETAGRVVDRSMQIHGGLGLTTELPLEYWFRQMRSLRITEGATEVMRWRLARNLIRKRQREAARA